MANIDIKSYNEILGDMIRKIVADTPANDINRGSVLLTLLEAAASNDFENNTAILNVLELLNIDAIRNNDLDAYASNLGLTRNTSAKSSGFIVISDSSIVKRSTSLYPIKPAPIAGTSVLYVNDATGWSNTGNVYIGRGTPNFEGPLSYSSIVDNGTFFSINLDAALEKDHLLSESVIDGQGTSDRQVSAGTVVKIPANNVSPEIEYVILRNSVIPAGEDTSDQIPVVAIKAGSESNAGINTITLFSILPFASAKVTNSNAFTNGRDTESDDEFRDRIKAYSSSLARGTKRSILSSIIGVSDDEDGKQVESAVITEPPSVGEPSIVYLDDGQGFQPSYKGQSVDVLVSSASGNEEFLQLANYPLPRPQCVNNADAPFLLLDGSELKVSIDGIEESVVFYPTDFKNITAASIAEMVTVINRKSQSFKCRLTANSTRLLLYPVENSSETIKVSSDGSTLDANTQLKFPTNEFSYIKLYRNNDLLKEVEKPAALVSTPFPTWDVTGPGNLILSVDGTPDQDRSFDTSDFGGSNFNTLTVADWAEVFNKKYAGITATYTTSGRLVITSNKEGSSSTVEAISGTYLEKMFSGQPIFATGQNSDFILNRQNGNIQLRTSIQPGDVITAGSTDTKGAIVSSSASGGTFNVSTDAYNRPAEMIVVADGSRVLPRPMNIPVGSTILLSDQGSDIMRVMSNTTSAFRNVQPGDFVYITSRGHDDGTGTQAWIDVESSGLFKVTAKGEHLSSGVDSYIEVSNANMVVGGPYVVQDGVDIQAFSSDKYPQLWRGSYSVNPVASQIQAVVDSINNNIKNVKASIFRTNYIKLTSTSEENGSIAIPVSVGSAAQLFTTGQSNKNGTQTHIANRVQDKDAITIFRRSDVSYDAWLDRFVYSDVKGSLTSSSEPSTDGSGVYSEELTDTATVDFETDCSYNDSINITSGSNKRQIRNIRSIIDADNVGTRHEVPRTLMDYSSGDQFQVVSNLELSYEDNLVAIIDNDAVAKTIDISFSRTGQVNSGSQSGSFTPNNLAFSANDADNEPGIDFGTLSVWGTLVSQSNTNFDDYAMWFKARNWYSDNGAALILRAKEFGPIGDKIKFRTEYPSLPDSQKIFSYTNSGSGTLATYTFGSGAEVSTNLFPGDLFLVEDLGSSMFRIIFPSTADITSVNENDVLNIISGSGFSTANTGTFSILAKNDINKTIDIYNPDGVGTIIGEPTIQEIECVADVADSLDGTYFVLTDHNGDTVKFWYDNNDSGTIEPDIGTTTRSWEINIPTNSSAIAVATATAAAILNDTAFASATNSGGTIDTITVTNAINAAGAAGYDGVYQTFFNFFLIQTGIDNTYETLTISNKLKIYPLQENDTSTIKDAINESSILEAVEQTPGTLNKATRQIFGTSVNDVAYDHDSDPSSGKNSHVSLWDSTNWVLKFQNINPNFQLKSQMLLSGISPVYSMDTTLNEDGSQGEKFKLVPITLSNIRHHMSHKALSQLDIVSDINFANDGKKIQITSQLLGSDGAIEIVGGQANSSSFKVIGDSQIVQDSGKKYIELKIPGSPNVLSPGQHVMLSNDYGVERLNRMISTDTMDVVKINDEIFEYRYNAKNINFSNFTNITIVDANSVDPVSYPTPNIVWRWQHDDSGSKAVFIDNNVGVVSAQPNKYSASGVLGGGTNISIVIDDPGSASTELSFSITMSGTPLQADYVTFVNSVGSTWAVWFDIDSAGSAPTGVTYLSAANQIQVDILSADSPNQIISKFVSAILTNGITSDFELDQTLGASLSEVREGNLLTVLNASAGWSNTNTSSGSGANNVSGMPIIKVNASNRYIDVVNPDGVAMSSNQVGSSEILVSSTPIIEWKLKHSAMTRINTVSISSNEATATTDGPHRLNVGDIFVGTDIPSSVAPDTGVVTAVLGENQFKYASTNPNATIAPGGFFMRTGKNQTRYKIESLGYNNMFRLKRFDGDSPNFTRCGAAVDDLLIIGGSTFSSTNNGEFRILAVDQDSIIYQNINAREELNTFVPFNNLNLEPNWISNTPLITGIAGTFTNLNVGDWVKKVTDDDTLFVQVLAFNASPELATIVTLANSYVGVTGSSPSHRLDQNSDIDTGMILKDVRDIRIIEGDSVRTGDEMFITENINQDWFSSTNSGNLSIREIGTNSIDGRVYLQVKNLEGIEEFDVAMNIQNTKFSIIEGASSKFTTIKKIHHIAIDEFNPNRRVIFLDPGNRSYKWSQTNSTSIVPLGKLGYSLDVVAGIDGYLYYTGLLRKVQRIIDGFEPDPANFPGRKAVGSLIEILPPLPVKISMSLEVTTQDGINLSEISDEITSVIINYVSDLGVGEDVILSDVIVRVKNIDGVAAVTFIEPVPSNERIFISDYEKAFIEPSDISIA